MVRVTGLEPVRQRHTPLKRACLPIPALPHNVLFYLTLRFLLLLTQSALLLYHLYQ